MFDKFTNRAKKSVQLGKKEANRLNHNYLGTEHLLLGLLKLGQGIAVNFLKLRNIDHETVAAEVERLVGIGPEAQTQGDPALTAKVKTVFVNANEEASKLHHNYVGTEHLFLALIAVPDGVAVQCLENLQVNIKEIRTEITKELETFNLQLPPMSMGGPSPTKPSEKGTSGDKTPALKAYGHDLTENCREGKLDPVIGRSAEIERLIQILCRRRKNNPVLVGEAGVGKTAIVEGLAHAIVRGDVPDILRDKTVITLDLPLMISGTKYRGQFEERIKAVMDEVNKHGNILLFIDEMHTIVGAGAAEGAIDASNILKPALSRGEIQCIGATTLDEFRKHIEKDPALERRFQKVNAAPPSIDESIHILMGLKPKYEEHHRCIYTNEAIEQAVIASERYIAGRFLPDKAIDLIDEAGAKARITSMHMPQELVQLEAKIETLTKAKDDAINSQDYEKAAALRDDEKSERANLEKLRLAWENEKEEMKVIVDADDIAEIIAKQTGVPITRLTEGETQRVLDLHETLKTCVIGQDEAVTSVCRSIRRSKADIQDPNRPIGAFMFLGPTGVGKTLLAKQLAIHMFGGEDALIHIDMSEYMEKFAVSRMTGSPPGYVGHEEGGQLTERVRQRPYSVVLFDEIEKAHPDVLNIMLQILEEGRLTDSFGRRIDFRNTIVIMTSNLGANKIARGGSMGFSATHDALDYENIKKQLTREAERGLKPELINRLDDLIIFRPLDRAGLKQVIEIEIAKVTSRLSQKNIRLTLDESAKNLLVDKGFQPEHGARPMRRVIEQHLQDQIAELILRRPEEGGSWHVKAKGKDFQFTELKTDKDDALAEATTE